MGQSKGDTNRASDWCLRVRFLPLVVRSKRFQESVSYPPEQVSAEAGRQRRHTCLSSDAVIGGRQNDAVRLACALYRSLGRDLASVVNPVSDFQLVAGRRADQGVEVGHHAVALNECPDGAACARKTNHLTEVVHAKRQAIAVARESAQIGYDTILPPKSVEVLLSGKSRHTSHGALIIHCERDAKPTSQAAEISYGTVRP